MKKVIEFLSENPVQYLATVGRDGKAKCRPFMFAGEMDGNPWPAVRKVTMRVYKCLLCRRGIVERSASNADKRLFEIIGGEVRRDEPAGA